MTVKDSLVKFDTISKSVDPDSSETTEILIKDQNKTFYFTDLNGCKAAGNLFSTREKMAKALGISLSDIVKVIIMNHIDEM